MKKLLRVFVNTERRQATLERENSRLKKIVGYYADIQCRSCHWLEALNDAVNSEFADGVRDSELSLMSDNGSQPTS